MNNNQPRKKKYANNNNTTQSTKSTTTNKRSSKLHPVQYFPRNSGLCGLVNLGNTCYLNAALQALSNCPQLTSYMLENYENMNPGLAKHFALLLYEIWVHGCFEEYSNQTNIKVFYDYLSPTRILLDIRNACPNFRSSAQQEDAQEFLRCFLEKIHDELKTPVPTQINELNNDQAIITESNSTKSSNLVVDDCDNNLINLNSSNEEKDELNQHSNDQQYNGYKHCSSFFDDNILINEKNEISYQNSESTSNQLKSNNSINHLSESFNIPFNETNQKGDSMINQLLSNSLNNYLLDERTDEITLGLGDINNQLKQNLNGIDDDYKENDQNQSNTSLNLCFGLTEDELKNDLSDSKKKVVYQSIISQMFNGEILNSVQCLTCNNISTIKETFQDLSLPIPNREDLQQTRQLNCYLKSLENTDYSSIIGDSSNDVRLLKDRKKKPKTRIKNGYNYRRLMSDERGSPSKTTKHSRRLVKLPIIKHLFIFFLFINYFFKAYVLYFLLSIFYWSQTNLWGPTITLNDCLEAFFSTDELKDNNMYSCEKCKKLRNGIKYTNLVKSPEILCIHFKRFRNEHMFPSKISTYVSFPIRDLTITSRIYEDEQQLNSSNLNRSTASSSETHLLNHSQESCKSEKSDQRMKFKRKIDIYDLVSVICHRGHYNGGHYITYALNCLDECWYEYDDKTVRKVDESKVLCEAYVVFYKRRNDCSIIISDTDNDERKDDKGDDEQCALLNENNNDRSSTNELINCTSNDSNEISTQKLSFFFRKYKNVFNSNNKLTSQAHEMFRKRKYDKINGENDADLDETTDLLGDISI